MGMIFGKIDVAQPAFEVALRRASPAAKIPYEIRRYGTRFAIETEFSPGGGRGDKDMRSPFMALAGYIGVIGEAENEGRTSIAMTAPVVMDDGAASQKKGVTGGEKIAMTAPVVMEDGASGDSGASQKTKKMQFILPAEYDDMSKIPKPTNSQVTVKKLDPSVGAVHRFTGSFQADRCREKARELVKQLNEDGLSDLSEEEALEKKYQYWGYNPPWTIPFLKRNEVWIQLTKKQVDDLVKNFGKAEGSGEDQKDL